MEKKLVLICMGMVLKESENDGTKSFQKIQENMATSTLRKTFNTLSQNIKQILNGIGIDANKLTAKEIIVRALPLIPFVQNNTYMWQYGRASFGKTYFLAKVLSPSSTVISGKITIPQLFGDIRTKDEGLVGSYKVLGFEDTQSLNLTTEEIGAILNFVTTGEARIKNASTESKTYQTGFIFNGNFEDDIEKKLQNDPYNDISNLLSTSFPSELNKENFKTRIICIPTWISRELITISSNNSEITGYQIEFLMDKFEKLRAESICYTLEKPLEISRLNTNIRKIITGLYKLFNFSQLVLEEKEITTQLDMRAFEFIARKIVELPFSNSEFTLVGNTAVNQLWIKLSEHLMKYPLTSITKAYIDEHRITIKFEEEKDSWYKIALDSIGIAQNKTEVGIYQDIPELYKDFLVPIFPIGNDYISVEAKTSDDPFSNYQEVKNIKKLLEKNISIEVLKSSIENSELLEYLTLQEKNTNNRIQELENIITLLEDFILKSFSTNERMAIESAPLTKNEKESLTYNIINYLAEGLSIPKDNFKNYHFVLNENNKKVKLLHYHYLYNYFHFKK